jgi:transposase
MYSYVTLAQRIPGDHPTRAIREMVGRALARMDGELQQLYSTTGRPSITPERLLRASLVMVLYSTRSVRQLMEQLNYNLLFPRFVGWRWVTVFNKNWERLIAGAVSQQLLPAVLEEAQEHNLLSEKHLTVDETIIQAWVAARSSKGQGTIRPSRATVPATRFRCSCATRWSRPPMGRRACIGRREHTSLPSYQVHSLMENRNGLWW